LTSSLALGAARRRVKCRQRHRRAGIELRKTNTEHCASAVDGGPLGGRWVRSSTIGYPFLVWCMRIRMLASTPDASRRPSRYEPYAVVPASTGLCGGWLVTAIPTGTVFGSLSKLSRRSNTEVITPAREQPGHTLLAWIDLDAWLRPSRHPCASVLRGCRPRRLLQQVSDPVARHS